MQRFLATITSCLMIATCGLDGRAAQPNVLFIAVDDLRSELGCYGNEHVKSPNIDQLAAQGTLFERAYCQQTVCNPSRASLLTGMRPDTLKVWDLPTHFRQRKPNIITLPQFFKNSGYHTQCVGKIFHNWRQDQYKGDAISWSVPATLHYNSHSNDQPQVAGKLPPNLASGKGGTECRNVPDNAYFDGRVAETAIDTLRAIGKADKPFFLAVGFWKPHTPFNAPKKYWDLYDRETIPVPQHIAPPTDVPDIAITSARYHGGANSAELREMHHGHLAAISYLDTQVGRVLNELDALGLSNDTIVVFWSDHGLHLGEHGLTRKTTVFELDARVPLIIRTPKHESGQRTEALVELLDLYPTLTDLCELDGQPELEGVSLAPLLDHPDSDLREFALTQTPRPNYPRGKPPKVMGYSIRTQRYRYTQWQDFQSGEIQARELYDHDNDPRETVNLAEHRDQQAIVAKLGAQLDTVLSQSSKPLQSRLLDGPEQKKGKPVESVDRPNIIFIMADDLGYGDLGCYGQQLISTPRIDQLAAEGIRFTQAYAGGPVCTASRSVLMTGLHNGHTPARDNVPHYSTYLQESDITIAELLKQAGYRCGGVGKWSLGDAGTVGRATNQGFDTWLGYLNQDHAHYYFTEYLDDDEGRVEFAGNAASRTHYSHDLLTHRALEFIRESKDKPFFLYLAWTLPHFSAAQEDPDRLTIPSTAPYSKKAWSEQSKKYAAMVHRLDVDVGRIMDLVDEMELAENTLIIFTSDNGGHATVSKRFNTSGPLRGFKRRLTEGGIRVPFIARWTGSIPTHKTSDEVIAFQDILPTFTELAGVKSPQGIDGISVVKALRGGKIDSTREFLYWDYGHCRRRYDQAVRWKDWKGIRLGTDGRIQLYDLATDLSESHDVATKNPDVVRRIAKIMHSAATPSQRYPIGKLYNGGPLWTPAK